MNAARRLQQGFSLVETILYVLIVSIVIGTIFTTFSRQFEEENASADLQDIKAIFSVANSATLNAKDYSSLSAGSLNTFQASNALPLHLNGQVAPFTGRSNGVLTVATGHSVPAEPTFDVFQVTTTGVGSVACLQMIINSYGFFNVTVNTTNVPYSAATGYQAVDIAKMTTAGICAANSNKIIFTALKQNDISKFRVTPAGTVSDPATPSDAWVRADFLRQKNAAAARLALQSSL